MSVALGSDVNLSVQDRRFALQKAIDSYRLDQVKHVLQQGVNPNSLDCHGSTALIQAIKNNRSDIVEFLLEVGADPNVSGDFGHTALMEAARGSNLEIVHVLIESKANINAQDRKFKSTPLMRAVSAGQESVTRCLLEAGADLELLNNQGQAVTTLAEKYCRNKNIIKLIQLAPFFKNLAVEYNSFESEPSPEKYIEDVCIPAGLGDEEVMLSLSDDEVHKNLATLVRS